MSASLASVTGWEVRKLAAQWKARGILIGSLVAPIPIAVIVAAQPRPPKDTLFGRFATDNGFALALTILGFAAQWVLPLVAAVVAGDIFASEDQFGTWKTVLTRSAGRAKIFWAKVITVAGFTALWLALFATSATVASLLAGGHQPLVGLTGQFIASHEALRLVALSWVAALAPTLGFACLAMALSIATRNPAAGIAVPVVLAMAMRLVGALGGVVAARPLLLTTPYETWHGLLTAPQFTQPLTQGLIVSAAWGALALAVGFVLFRRRDVTGG